MMAAMDHEPQVTPSTTCRVCGRRLTDPESIKAGVGPICAENLRKQELMDKWIEESTCPECGKANLYPDSLYCPHCGAKMRERTVKVVPA